MPCLPQLALSSWSKGREPVVLASQPDASSSPGRFVRPPWPLVSLPPMRLWTVAEAKAYLPRARELVEAVRTAVATASAARTNGHGRSTRPAGAPPPIKVQDALAELEEGDIVLRDPDRGLIDFPSRGDDGVLYYLCWLTDEDDLTWWHLPEEGFAGRKPLPRIP